MKEMLTGESNLVACSGLNGHEQAFSFVIQVVLNRMFSAI